MAGGERGGAGLRLTVSAPPTLTHFSSGEKVTFGEETLRLPLPSPFPPPSSPPLPSPSPHPTSPIPTPPSSRPYKLLFPPPFTPRAARSIVARLAIRFSLFGPFPFPSFPLLRRALRGKKKKKRETDRRPLVEGRGGRGGGGGGLQFSRYRSFPLSMSLSFGGLSSG